MAPPTIPVGCPSAIVAGDTVVFDDGPFTDATRGSFGSDLYTLAYQFRNTSGELVSATTAAQGTGWRITISGANTLLLKDPDVVSPETVHVVASVTLSGERYTVWVGTVLLWPDPTTGAGWQSEDEKMLALVRAAIASLLSSNVTSYSIAGRAFTKHDLPTLMRVEALYAARVDNSRGDGSLGRAVEVQFR